MRIHSQRQRCSPRYVVSGDIRLMSIFVGVRWWCGVKWECGHRKCEFSLSIASLYLPCEVPHWLYISKLTRRSVVSRRQHGCCPKRHRNKVKFDFFWGLAYCANSLTCLYTLSQKVDQQVSLITFVKCSPIFRFFANTFQVPAYSLGNLQYDITTIIK